MAVFLTSDNDNCVCGENSVYNLTQRRIILENQEREGEREQVVELCHHDEGGRA